MNVEVRSIEELSADPANVRTHSDRNLDSIAASLKRFGQQKPIVIGTNGVVRAGNGTLEAARMLGWTDISVVVSDLPDIELTAYAIADNRTGELASWDVVALAQSLKALEEGGGIEGTGYSAAELAALAKVLEKADDDEAKPDVEPVDIAGIDEYDEDSDTYTLRVSGIMQRHKDDVEAAVQDVLGTLSDEHEVPYELVIF